MSLLDKIFKKKKRSDELAKKGFPQKQAGQAIAQGKREKKDLTLAELTQKEQEKPKSVKEKKTDTKDAYRVLIKPLVTEKGTYLHSANKYLFEVAPQANKIMIKRAIWHLYGVKPVKINIIKLPGKDVKFGRTHGRTKDTKKAVITLKSGDSIQVYEGV